jgi:hypothetical protein
MERLDPGISVPVEGCVRDLEPDDCHEFQEKWYSGNDNGFRDSMEEEMMSIDEYRDYIELKDNLRYQALKKMLKIEQDKKDHDDLMKEKF